VPIPWSDPDPADSKRGSRPSSSIAGTEHSSQDGSSFRNEPRCCPESAGGLAHGVRRAHRSRPVTAERPSPASPIPPPAGAGSPVAQRAALGQGVCTRSACRRPFQQRRSGGIPQRFCTARCRRLADAEFRRAARSGVPASSLLASSPASARRSTRQRSADSWRTGIDAATGRRVKVAIRHPSMMARSVGDWAPL
jgi:hypothetical protein